MIITSASGHQILLFVKLFMIQSNCQSFLIKTQKTRAKKPKQTLL